MDTFNSILREKKQKELFYILQIKKIWKKDIGGFFVRYAEPNKIIFINSFEFKGKPIKYLKNKINPTIWNKIKNFNGKNCKSLKEFNIHLNNFLDRKLSKKELRIINSSLALNPVKCTLFFNVYDGSIAQAIKLEESHYLNSLNSKLNEISINSIKCRIGEVTFNKNDVLFDKINEIWLKLEPEIIFRSFEPYKIYKSRNSNIFLIIMCLNLKILNKFKSHPREIWLLNQLKNQFPEIGSQISGLSLIYSDKNLSNSKYSNLLPDDQNLNNSSKKFINHKKNLRNLIKIINEK